MPRTRVMVTGASGYIGRRLVAAALAEDLPVVALVRRPDQLPPAEKLRIHPFDLASSQGLDEAFTDVGVVIHLAAIISEDSWPSGATEDLNVSGTRRLLEAARRNHVRRFIFMSSPSADPAAPSRYGQSKWQIEQMLSGEREINITPGMVCGGPPRGLYGQLLRIVKRWPVFPIVNAQAPIYPIHVDDLCDALLEIARADRTPPRHLRIAPLAAISFHDYLKTLARERLGSRIRLIPIPRTPVLALLRIAGVLPILSTNLQERLAGLIALQPRQPAEASSGAFELRLREIARVLREEGRTRRLLVEGRTLTRYTIGPGRPSSAQRRYVRAVLATHTSEPLDLPTLVHCLPRLLRFLERSRKDSGSGLRQRLAIAARTTRQSRRQEPG